jgi:PAS domain S-box-containing protein
MDLACAACGGPCSFADRYCRACGTALYTPGDERSSPTLLASHILQSVPHSVIVTTPNGTINYWNRGAEALFGWRADEVLGQNILTVTPGESMAESAADIMVQLRAGATWSGEFALRRRDGTPFRAWVTDAPIAGPDGTLHGIVGITFDLPDHGYESVAWQDEAARLQEGHRRLQPVRGAIEAAAAQALQTPHRAPPVPYREAMWPDLTEPLTARELEVLDLLARRLTNKEIATTLCLSWQTVAKHTNNIFQKLRVTGRRDAVARAAALGILSVGGDPGAPRPAPRGGVSDHHRAACAGGPRMPKRRARLHRRRQRPS